MFFKKKQDIFYDVGMEVEQTSIDKYKCLDAVTRGVLDKAKSRITLVMIVFSICFCVIIGRLFYLSIILYQSRAYNPSVLQTGLDFGRYNITDRTGMILATSVPTKDLSLNPQKIKNEDKAEIAKNLSAVLNDVTYEEVLAKLNAKNAFQYIKRNLTPKERQDVNWLGYYFLSETDGEKRVYPQGNLFSHILGSVDIDNKGTAGIERAFDEQLRQKDVHISLDLSIQEVVRRTLKEKIDFYQALGGMGVVMDVNSGEILASVSLPDYNPNLSLDDEVKNRFNKVSLGSYEFGSVFKLFNTAMGLENKVIQPQDTVDAKTPIKIGRKTFEDYMGQKRMLMIPEVLMHSSNLGSMEIAFKVEPEVQRDFLGRFGLYKQLDVELPEKASVQYPQRQKWADVTRANVAFGYGISVSALHLVAGVASLINGGYYYAPTFIKNGNEFKPEYHVISEKTSDIMRHLMWGVINWSDRTEKEIKPYNIGGKTGTANLLIDGKYTEGTIRTTFIGAFPMNKPKYVVLVMLEDPKKLKETLYFNAAGWNAKPTGIEIIKQIAPYLGVAQQEIWDQPKYMQQAMEKSNIAREIRENRWRKKQ